MQVLIPDWAHSLTIVVNYYCVSRLNETPVFAVYSIMVILIKIYIKEMNLDIDRVIRIFFSLKCEFLYRLGLDGISTGFCSSPLNQSPSVPH